jgi:putative zinc finger protein
MSDPTCRGFRELLGVYVVGAVEPAERALIDAHLSQCYGCREELAGLAVLPALLHRIPVAEAEQLALPELPQSLSDDPAPRVFSELLAEVRSRRRSRRLRTVLAMAAAVIVAIGGGAAAAAGFDSHQHASIAQPLEVASAHRGALSVTVKYGKSGWGTEMLVRVSGVRQGTHCQFWVTTSNGRSVLVGGWLVGYGGDRLWYPTRANVPAGAVTGFTLASAGKVLVHIPAS